MATITAATTYPNGAALSIAGHNANIYTTASGQGILSEPNGGLSINNLDPSFEVKDEHVMAEEATFARMNGTTFPVDVYNNAFGIRSDEDPGYVAIAGLCERIYVPYTVAAGVWQWSFFVVPWRPFLYNLQTEEADIPPMAIRVFIDGVEQPAFRRYFSVSAETYVQPPDPTGDIAFVRVGGDDVNHEQIVPLWFDISKLATAVTPGFHELSAKLYLPRIVFDPNSTGDEDELELGANISTFAALVDGSVVGSEGVTSTLHTRVTFGTRNVRFVAFG